MKILAISLSLMILCSLCLAEETDYYDWKGLKSYAAKDYSASIGYFDTAIKQDPDYIDAWVHKGDAQRAAKDYNGSLESYNGALQIKNDSKSAWSGMIEAYIALNRYQEASEAAAVITEIEPKRKENWLKEGNLWQMQGDYERAAEKYDQALELDRNYPDALYRKAVSLLALENNSGAMSLLDRIIEVDPKHKLAHNARGLSFEAEGEYAFARAAYENASKIDSQWAQPRINNIHSLLWLNMTGEAMRTFVAL